MKSNNSPYEPQKLKKISPPIKIGKTKQVLGKTIFEKKKGGVGINTKAQTKF